MPLFTVNWRRRCFVADLNHFGLKAAEYTFRKVI